MSLDSSGIEETLEKIGLNILFQTKNAKRCFSTRKRKFFWTTNILKANRVIYYWGRQLELECSLSFSPNEKA